MAGGSSNSDTRPLTWIGRVPIYGTTILVSAVIAMTVVLVLLESANASLGFGFGFDPEAFWKRGHVWQILTHPILNELNFFYIFGIFFIYSFGVAIETHLGRVALIKTLAILCVAPALICTAFWLADYQVGVAGILTLTSGLMIAYATLYPGAEFWNWITMKWLAFVCIVAQSLMFFPKRNWIGLTIFLGTCAASHLYTRYEMGHWALPRFRFRFNFSFGKRANLRVLPDPEPRRKIPAAEMGTDLPDDDTDLILDKIAKSGIDSLTERERATLEKAREALLKKESH